MTTRPTTGLTDAAIVDALNLWMDAFICRPEQFRQQYTAIREHLAERGNGVEPTYGQIGLAFMNRLLEDQAKGEDQS